LPNFNYTVDVITSNQKLISIIMIGTIKLCGNTTFNALNPSSPSDQVPRFTSIKDQNLAALYLIDLENKLKKYFIKSRTIYYCHRYLKEICNTLEIKFLSYCLRVIVSKNHQYWNLGGQQIVLGPIFSDSSYKNRPIFQLKRTLLGVNFGVDRSMTPKMSKNDPKIFFSK
jgi:hypothetical protein